MKPTYDDDITAYDVASIAIHWLARQWSRAPSVAARLRNIADWLSDRSDALRKAAYFDEDPLDTPSEMPTDRVTLPYGSKPD